MNSFEMAERSSFYFKSEPANCYICHECGAMFDRPRIIRNGAGRALYTECPSCGSDDIEETYDEDLDDYLRGERDV